MSRRGLVILSGFLLFLVIFKFERIREMVTFDSGTPEAVGESRYNHLALEKSPYLLQHADNPVDWYPWGDEAFSKALHENKPIFLSIGYSACHWCQVMEEESFRDEEVAAFLNEHFVSIKVDREERPDIDNIYMTVSQSMTGSGGWPLTILMTPDEKPFFAGTYFPRQPRQGLPGFLELLQRVVDLWEKDRAALTDTGDRVTEALRKSGGSTDRTELGYETLERAYRDFKRRFDEAHGGFGTAPKFPSPHNISFLLRWWKRSKDEGALQMAEKTLTAMRQGGIYDHLGNGFHRYSTDERWLVPHFEKMLYDQAMLAIAYIDMYQATGDLRYRRTVEDIFTYVFRDLTSREGAFYSSENADSEGEEGKFYSWTPQEVVAVLGPGTGEIFNRFFGVDEAGDLHDGRSVLHPTSTVEDFAAQLGVDTDELDSDLSTATRELFISREQRVRPSKDDKILTDWNGLMIAALAKASQAFDEPEYAAAAERAADFIKSNLMRSDGRLLHRYRDKEAAIPAFLDDYAFLTWGLIELYEATFKPAYLSQALSLTEDMIRLFGDEQSGRFFLTAADGEELIMRPTEAYDGAIPSGNSIAALNLLRLGKLAQRSEFLDRAWELFRSFSAQVNKYPAGFSQLLIAVDFFIGPSSELVVAGEIGDEKTEKMIKVIRTHFLPRNVVLLNSGDSGREIEGIAPFIRGQGKVNGAAAVYVCENFTCKLPVLSESDLETILRELD